MRRSLGVNAIIDGCSPTDTGKASGSPSSSKKKTTPGLDFVGPCTETASTSSMNATADGGAPSAMEKSCCGWYGSPISRTSICRRMALPTNKRFRRGS
jgi:hypothetical protein